MADVTAQMLNTHVVLPRSTASSTHSGYAAPLRPKENDPVYHGDCFTPPSPSPVDPGDEPMFSQHRVHEFNMDRAPDLMNEGHTEDSAVEHETHEPVPEAPRAGSILGLTAPVITGSTARHIEASPRPIEESEPEPRVSSSSNSFLHFDESAATEPTTEVSGPSFLGLGATSSGYLFDNQPRRSYGRAFVLLFLVAVLGVLGFLEWRASQNGESTNPIDVLHLKLPKKKGQGQVEVLPQTANAPAPSASNSDNAADASSGTNGKPDLIAEPNQSAAQKQQPNQPTESNIPPSSGSQPSQVGSSATSSPPANVGQSQAPPAKQPTASQTSAETPTEVAKSSPPAQPTPKPSAREEASTPSARSTKPSAAAAAAPSDTPAEDASLNGGAFELQKGVAAGDTEMGRMWLWKALGKGNGQAPVLLADMYAQGRGVPKDCEQAMLLLNSAAKKPNVRARSKLGSMYATGECVPQDKVKAFKWMSAALEINPGSEWLTKNRDTLLKEMTPAERQRATR
jgi:hypothetical protein